MDGYIRGFLANRRFQTKVGSHLSTPHPQEDRLPQGNVLSCSLFSVAINSVLACLPHSAKGILYVDDPLIHSSGAYYPAIERRIQMAINSVHDCTLKRGFTFFPAKSVAIHFHHKRTMLPPASLLLSSFHGRPIPARESIKYLGMLLDRRLTYNEHIACIKGDCMKRLDMLKFVSRVSCGAVRTVMLCLYEEIVRAKLDYGSIVYMSVKDTALKVLDTCCN